MNFASLSLSLGLALAASLTTPAHAASPASSPAFRGTVVQVTDGDSVKVRPLDGGSLVTVRIVGIDAPEICQAGGPQAREALRERIGQQVVTVSEGRPDANRRRLARVGTDEEPDLGRWLVSQGHPWSWEPRRGGGPYGPQELLARLQGRGLWAEGSAMEPRAFRRSHGPCHRR
jgi:micrococcal nuclease